MFLLVILAVCLYYLWYQTKVEEEREYGTADPLTYTNPQLTSDSKSPGSSTIHSDYPSGLTSPSYVDPRGSNSSGLQGAGALGLDFRNQPYFYKGGRPQKLSTSDVQPQMIEMAAPPKVHYSYRGGRPDYSGRPDYIPRQVHRPDYSQAYETASSTMGTERSHPYTEEYVNPSFQSTQPSLRVTPTDPNFDADDNSQSELIAPVPPRRAPYSYQGGRPSTSSSTQAQRARTPPYLLELDNFTRRPPSYINETSA